LSKRRAENAIAFHLKALDLDPLPVRWVSDLEEAQPPLDVQRLHGARAARIDAVISPEPIYRSQVFEPAGMRAAHAIQINHQEWRATWRLLEDKGLRGADTEEDIVGGVVSVSAVVHASRTKSFEPLARRFLEVYQPLFDACESGIWVMWFLRHEVVAVPRPELKVVEGQLHCETGPALFWKDGAQHWFWRGVRVPRPVVVRPDRITSSAIMKERNIEVRRVMLERYGVERFLCAIKARPIHTDTFGQLYRAELRGEEPLAVVKVVNSTPGPDGARKAYFLRVPPYVRSARQAVAWTFGIEATAYAPAIET
jgi:hypothetical protein